MIRISQEILLSSCRVKMNCRSNVTLPDFKQSQIVVKSPKANMISCQNLSTVGHCLTGSYNRIMQWFTQLLSVLIFSSKAQISQGAAAQIPTGLIGQPFFST